MSMRGWVAAALLGLVVYATNVYQARAAAADPAVWGVYAQVVGTSWKGKFGTRAQSWGEGNQIIEDDSSFGRSVITPGPTLGTLTLKLGSSGLHTFQGTIASDGSVLWIRDGMLKMPYRVLLRDGELVEESVKLSGREVAAVKRAMRYQQVGGLRNAAQSTPLPMAGPASPAPVANAPTANADAASSKAVPSTPISVFGPLGTLDGQLFAGDVLSLKIQTTNGGRSLTLDQEGISTYVLNATDVPGTYSVPMHPNTFHEYHVEDSFVGHLNDDGAIEIRYQTRGVSGSKYATDLYRFDGNRIVIEKYSEKWGARRMVGYPEVYVTATPELLQLAVANAISITRAHEEGEIENRRAAAEDSQAIARSFNNMLGDLQDFSAREQQIRADADATMAAVDATFAAARQQQAQDETQQRQVHASPMQQPMAAPQVPAADATAGTGGGSLTVEATPPAPKVAIAAKVANQQMLVACFLVHNGDFDQGKGAVFFSRTMPITMEKGQTLGGPTDSFRSKVKSTYNTDGGAACQTSADASELQRYMQDVGVSYRTYKKIDTGISPLD